MARARAGRLARRAATAPVAAAPQTAGRGTGGRWVVARAGGHSRARPVGSGLRSQDAAAARPVRLVSRRLLAPVAGGRNGSSGAPGHSLARGQHLHVSLVRQREHLDDVQGVWPRSRAGVCAPVGAAAAPARRGLGVRPRPESDRLRSRGQRGWPAPRGRHGVAAVGVQPPGPRRDQPAQPLAAHGRDRSHPRAGAPHRSPRGSTRHRSRRPPHRGRPQHDRRKGIDPSRHLHGGGAHLAASAPRALAHPARHHPAPGDRCLWPGRGDRHRGPRLCRWRVGRRLCAALRRGPDLGALGHLHRRSRRPVRDVPPARARSTQRTTRA